MLIHEKDPDACFGMRGVVTFAVSLITFIYDGTYSSSTVRCQLVFDLEERSDNL